MYPKLSASLKMHSLSHVRPKCKLAIPKTVSRTETAFVIWHATAVTMTKRASQFAQKMEARLSVVIGLDVSCGRGADSYARRSGHAFSLTM